MNQSFQVEDCAFILFDSPGLNNAGEREKSQMQWLEQELTRFAPEKKRIFLCTHYPLFITAEDEQEHYDNIGEPARSRLLALIDEYRVDTVFTGHAHNFFYNRRKRTNFYSLPSTGFTRPEYSELFFIEPALEGEFGRNDFAKLGFFLVSVYRDRYDIDMIRLHDPAGRFHHSQLLLDSLKSGAPAAADVPLGFFLRNSWCAQIDMPCSDLDEFFRKSARNDHAILALIDLKVKNVRLPFSDLLAPHARERLRHLARLGFRFNIFSVDIPDERQLKLIKRFQSAIDTWEINIEWAQLPLLLDVLQKNENDLSCRIMLSKILTLSDQTMRRFHYFSHFVFTGFIADEIPRIEQHAADPVFRSLIDGVCLSIVSEDDEIWETGAMCVELTQRSGIDIDVDIQMKRDAEGILFHDEAAIANRTAEAFMTSLISRRTRLYLDTFIDHDRGYMPRLALLDRRYNPRRTFHVLKNLGCIERELADEGDRVEKIETEKGLKSFVRRTPQKGYILLLFQAPADGVSLTLPDSRCRFTDLVDLESGRVHPASAGIFSFRDGKLDLDFGTPRSMPVALRFDIEARDH